MPIIRNSTTAVAASGFILDSGGSSAVGRCRADRPDHDQQHCYHHAPMVKPEAATAVVELLMMGVRTPETVHKRQVINLRNCCIQFVDLSEFELALRVPQTDKLLTATVDEQRETG